MKFRIWLTALLLTPVLTATAGVDPYATRQSAGIFLTVSGRVHSIYVDFAARELREDGPASIEVTLTTDLDLRIEGHPLPAGRHEWTLDVAPGEAWSFGEPASRGGGQEKARRHLLAMTALSATSRWLSACLVPDTSGRNVELRFRLGNRVGLARLEVPVDAAEGKPVEGELDLVELRALRDRLREVAGALEGGRTSRHLWSVFLTELGDTMILHTKTGWVRGLRLTREGAGLSFETTGRVGADRRAAEEIRRSIGGGVLGQVFDRVEPVIPRAVPGEDAWDFTVRAEVTLENLLKTEPVAPLTPGDDAKRTAEEILLLEERLLEVSGRAAQGVGAFQEMLLGAKRRSACLLSKIEPGEVRSGTEGLWTQRVDLTVAGSGSALVRFVRELEDGEVPVRLLIESLGPGEFGPELRLEVTFLGYTGLAERNPRLLGAVRELGESPRFPERRRIYLQGLSRGAGVPFSAPRWERDPFAGPADER